MVEHLIIGLKAKLYGDRGYTLDGHHLKQCNKIKTLFSLLKGQHHLVTSKARSLHGFLGWIYASLCTYQLIHQNKPTIQIVE